LTQLPRRWKCYLLEDTGRAEVHLRRYTQKGAACGKFGYHNATVLSHIDDEGVSRPATQAERLDDRWPRKCDHCEYVFKPDDECQWFQRSLWLRRDTFELVTMDDAPAGAMWLATWLQNRHQQPSLCVKTIGGVWNVDSPASNCTRKGEPHDCWVRHGTPPEVTVDKQGDTCGAGSGSIIIGGWHGWLRNGWLETC